MRTQSEAIRWLTNTCVSKELPLNDYISQFQNNAEISGISNKDMLINFFSRGIPTFLMRRVNSMDTVPDTIEKWYKQAIHFKIQWNKADAVKKKPLTSSPSKRTPLTHQNHNFKPLETLM